MAPGMIKGTGIYHPEIFPESYLKEMNDLTDHMIEVMNSTDCWIDVNPAVAEILASKLSDGQIVSKENKESLVRDINDYIEELGMVPDCIIGRERGTVLYVRFNAGALRRGLELREISEGGFERCLSEIAKKNKASEFSFFENPHDGNPDKIMRPGTIIARFWMD